MLYFDMSVYLASYFKLFVLMFLYVELIRVLWEKYVLVKINMKLIWKKKNLLSNVTTLKVLVLSCILMILPVEVGVVSNGKEVDYT